MITIVVGNVGAIGQSSLKRLLAYSSVAQAGYMLAGVVVTTQLGVRATVFYLAVYLLMNLAAFAVIVARERETRRRRRHLLALRARRRPAAAGVADDDRDALAGRLPGDGGLLRQGLPDRGGGRTTTTPGSASVIVLGSAISLAYYLRVVAAVWMRSPARRRPAPGAARARRGAAGDRGRLRRRPTPTRPRSRRRSASWRRGGCGSRRSSRSRVVCAAATIFFGIYPSPLLDLATDAGRR